MAPSLKLLIQFAILIAAASHAILVDSDLMSQGQSQSRAWRTSIPETKGQNGTETEDEQAVYESEEIRTSIPETNGQSGTETEDEQAVYEPDASRITVPETKDQSGTETEDEQAVYESEEIRTSIPETKGQSGTETEADRANNGKTDLATNGQSAAKTNPVSKQIWEELFLARGKRQADPLTAFFTEIGKGAGNSLQYMYGKIVDGIAVVVKKAACKGIQKLCSSCGYGACIEHPGYTADAICCSNNFELKCCEQIPTTTPAPPEIVQVSRACDTQKKDCNCGWGSCIRSEGMKPTTCCAQDYEFQCCTTAPTTTPTTTLQPQQALDMICKKVARACSCGWAKCVKEEGAKHSFCCVTGLVYKCCVNPDRPYELVKRNTEDLVKELRKKDECTGKNHTCFCGIRLAFNIGGEAGLKFICCDTSPLCSCCESDWLLHVRTPDIGLPVAESCGTTLMLLYVQIDSDEKKYYHNYQMCEWANEAPPTDCCPYNYQYIYGSDRHYTMELCDANAEPAKFLDDEDCPSRKWPLVDKRSHIYGTIPKINNKHKIDYCNMSRIDDSHMCYDWFWMLKAVAKPKEPLGALDVFDNEGCKKYSASCQPCGWGKCVPYTGWRGSGVCCPTGSKFECCSNVLPLPIPGYAQGVPLPTMATTEIPPTISPTANEEANTAVNVLTSKMCCALASLLTMVLHFGNDHNQF